MRVSTIARPRAAGKAALIAATLVASVATSVAPASAADSPMSAESASYVAWLAAQQSTEADEIARQFKELSPQNQQKFLGYLNDSAIAKAMADAATEAAPASKVELAGGDVTLEAETGAKQTAAPSQGELSAAGTAGDWQCWSHRSQKVFGIKVTTYKLDQWYRASSSKVTKVYNVAARIKNWNPGVIIDNQPEEQWISKAGNALAYVTWNGKITVSGLTVQVDKRQHVRCDETGFRYDYLKNA
ncbi:hypothetical protein [Streptomyces flavofungini]|uniref:hypothetical protein n=1 Tax=Streptomyces flavofungini TaxID=68200 RepID=UPI0025B0C7DC|nr:hypothetical protein [Streptomyces flavofungini]WJV48911.1 hypothetical protein QUY26_27390 [Streptomyces flavofungini]